MFKPLIVCLFFFSKFFAFPLVLRKINTRGSHKAVLIMFHNFDLFLLSLVQCDELHIIHTYFIYISRYQEYTVSGATVSCAR